MTVKKAGDGFLVDGSLQVPNDPRNRHYRKIQEWIADNNIPEPEFTDQEIIDNKIKQEKSEAQKYLNNTDWYVLRQVETGANIPRRVKRKREKAREVLA